MPDTITPNYSLVKPEVTGSIDTWGNKLNANWDAVDVALKETDVSADGALQRGGVDINLRTATELIFLTDTLNPTTSDHALITTKYAKQLINNLLPIGTIIMWAGTVATIPTGWALCNGQTVGGVQTPNLQDRFLIGGGGTWSPGFSGGSSVFNYSGRVGGTVLDINMIPAHNHDIYDPTHYHPVSDPQHRHTSNAGGGTPETGFGATGGTVVAYGSTYTSYALTGISVAYAATNIQTYNRGSSWAHDHPISMAIAGPTWYPPFYAIAFIMKWTNV